MAEVPKPTGIHALALHHLTQLRAALVGVGLPGYGRELDDIEAEIELHWRVEWANAVEIAAAKKRELGL